MFLLFIAALFILSALYITVPLLSILSHEFQVSLKRAAFAGTAFSIFFALGCLIYGPLSSHIGRKKVMVMGLFALSVATFAAGFVEDFYILILLRCIQGATASTFSPVALTYAGEIFPENQRVTAIGYISTGFLMAGIVGQVWSSAIANWIGWPNVFMLLAIVYLIIAVSFIIWLPSAAKQPLPMKTNNKNSILLQFIRNKNLMLSYCITIMVLLCFVGTYSGLESYLSNPPFSLDFGEILAVRAIGIIGMLLCPFAGQLGKRFGTENMMRTGIGVAVISLIALCFSKSLITYAIVSLFFVTGIALLVPSLIAIIGELGGNHRALATSIYTFILFIGASLGPIATTLILNMELNLPIYAVFAMLFSIGFMMSLFITLPKATA